MRLRPKPVSDPLSAKTNDTPCFKVFGSWLRKSRIVE
jgi:hypothetical protein